MIRKLFIDIIGVELPNPFPTITYSEAIHRFGIDRPDLRNPLELTDISDLMKEVEFKVFSGPANQADGRVAALTIACGQQINT